MDRHDIRGSLALTLALLAALTGSYFFLNSPLVSLRPEQGQLLDDPSTEAQFLRARLWQDPLLVIYRDWEERTAAISLPHRPDRLPEALKQGEGRLLRLLVLLDEESYVESIEQRRRQRYALVSALTGKGYVPADESHIGYFEAPQYHPDPAPATPATPAAPGAERAGLFVAGYELFLRASDDDSQPPADDPAEIHVFWLNATDFDEHSLVRLTGLLAFLNNQWRSTLAAQDPAARPTNIVLAPNGTGYVQKFFRNSKLGDDDPRKRSPPAAEQNQRAADYAAILQAFPGKPAPAGADTGTAAARASAAELQALRAELVLISSNATGPLDSLLESGQQGNAAVPGQELRLEVARQLGIAAYHSSILTDDLLLERLLEELVDRGLCAATPGRIIVLAEQDSAYGRKLDRLLQQAASSLPRSLGPRRVAAAAEGETCPIISEIGYLRGIDGELPADQDDEGARPAREAGTQNAGGAQRSASQTVAELFAPDGMEVSFGNAQLDYISRLAAVIERQAKADDGPLVIGVLGSDVYDKLLILQSLRSRLPGALFFTTDLDTRLFGRQVYAWTRNLLIASSHGLEFDNHRVAEAEARAELPQVFRAAYQTSFFQATRMALDLASGATGPLSYVMQPRLFEVGRSGPIELTPPPLADPARWTSAGPPVNAESAFIFDDLRINRKYLLGLPLLLMLATVLYFRYVAPHPGQDWKEAILVRPEFLRPRPGRDLLLAAYEQAALVLAVALLLTLLLLRYVQLIGTEPLYLLEGLSTLPTLSLQLSIAAMAAALVLIALGKLREARKRLARDWRIRAGRDDEAGDAAPCDEESLSLQSVWERCLNGSVLRKGMIFAGIRAALGTALVITLANSGPDALLTGRLLFHFQGHDLGGATLRQIILVACILAVMLMYFLCTQAFALAARLIHCLSHRPVEGWPDSEEPPSLNAARRAMDGIVFVSEVVTPLIYFPFLLLTLLVISRSTLIEGWVWSAPLLLVLAGFLLYIFYRAASFQIRASKARTRILKRLEQEKWRRAQDSDYLRQVSHTLEEIQGLHSGAFVHWTAHPLFKAIALPSSSLGLLTLLL